MISVIITAYNIVKYLEKCVESVIGQTYKDLEIIIVDDGSSDGTEKLCDGLLLKDSRIVVVHKENGGLSDARNAGLDIAKGEYISFIDGDDYIDKEMYEYMIAAFGDRTDISFVACGVIKYYSNSDFREMLVSDKFKIYDRKQAYRGFFKTGEDTIGNSSCNKLYRYELFENLRFKKGIVCEDIELIYQLLDRCSYVACVPKAFYHYMYREGSITTSGYSIRRLDLLEILSEMGEFIQSAYPDLVFDFKTYELLWLIGFWDGAEQCGGKNEIRQRRNYIKRRIRENMKYYSNKSIYFKKGYRKLFLRANGILMHCYGIVKRL